MEDGNLAIETCRQRARSFAARDRSNDPTRQKTAQAALPRGSYFCAASRRTPRVPLPSQRRRPTRKDMYEQRRGKPNCRRCGKPTAPNFAICNQKSALRDATTAPQRCRNTGTTMPQRWRNSAATVARHTRNSAATTAATKHATHCKHTITSLRRKTKPHHVPSFHGPHRLHPPLQNPGGTNPERSRNKPGTDPERRRNRGGTNPERCRHNAGTTTGTKRANPCKCDVR